MSMVTINPRIWP